MRTCFAALSLLAVAACDDTPPYVQPADDSALECNVRAGPHQLRVEGLEPLVVTWEGEAWAAALTSPEATLGAFGRIRTGRLFWSLAASELDGTLSGPLEYGVVPAGATNYTAFGGGTFSELESGRCYEVQLSDRSHQQFSRLQFRAP